LSARDIIIVLLILKALLLEARLGLGNVLRARSVAMLAKRG